MNRIEQTESDCRRLIEIIGDLVRQDISSDLAFVLRRVILLQITQIHQLQGYLGGFSEMYELGQIAVKLTDLLLEVNKKAPDDTK